jgi:hypothetical protein
MQVQFCPVLPDFRKDVTVVEGTHVWLPWQFLQQQYKYEDEQLWSNTGRGGREPKYSGKNPYHCHFVHQKSHMDSPGIGADPTH